MVRCGECGLLRLDPQPPPEELGRYYPDNYWFAPDESAASRMEEAYRRLVLRDHVGFVTQALGSSRASGPLLDVGCGGGLFLGMMRERGFRVLGLDNSREAAAIAWRRQQAPSVCASLEQAPFPAESVAGLTMFHVVEHLYDPRAYLRAAFELLRPDGRLVVQVPNAASWQFRLLGRSWNGVDVPRHLNNFRDSDLVKLIESCGFEVVRRKYFSLRDNPAGLASSLAPSLDPMARRVRRIRETPGMRLDEGPGLPGAGSSGTAVHGTGSGVPGRLHSDDRGPPAVSYTSVAYRLPRWLRRHILHFECEIEDAVARFAQGMPGNARVLDAGSGEGQYAHHFTRQRYCGVDLAVGDAQWDYSRVDALADLTALPFRGRAFDAAIHIVTIEHLKEPGCALAEIGRTMSPGSLLLIAAPHEWEVHQAPHDYFRYTRYGLAIPFREERIRSGGAARGRRLFPASGEAAAQRTTILLRGCSPAVVYSGRDPAGPTGADSAVFRFSRPGPKFHAWIYRYGKKAQRVNGRSHRSR